jgi:hypothetical protein
MKKRKNEKCLNEESFPRDLRYLHLLRRIQRIQINQFYIHVISYTIRSKFTSIQSSTTLSQGLIQSWRIRIVSNDRRSMLCFFISPLFFVTRIIFTGLLQDDSFLVNSRTVSDSWKRIS